MGYKQTTVKAGFEIPDTGDIKDMAIAMEMMAKIGRMQRFDAHYIMALPEMVVFVYSTPAECLAKYDEDCDEVRGIIDQAFIDDKALDKV